MIPNMSDISYFHHSTGTTKNCTTTAQKNQASAHTLMPHAHTRMAHHTATQNTRYAPLGQPGSKPIRVWPASYAYDTHITPPVRVSPETNLR